MARLDVEIQRTDEFLEQQAEEIRQGRALLTLLKETRQQVAEADTLNEAEEAGALHAVHAEQAKEYVKQQAEEGPRADAVRKRLKRTRQQVDERPLR